MAEYILNLLPVTEEEKAAFQEAAPRAVHVCAGRRTVAAEQLEQATILFGWPRPADLSRAPRLKWFQSMWAGTDEYLAPGVLPEGVVLTSSAGSNSQSVAEHALACLLALCRRLPQCRDQQRERLWTDPGKMKTLSGATVLVAGAGHIGSWFAGLCRGLGAHTVGLKRDVSRPVEGFDRLAVMEEMDGLLPQADVVALMLPHSPQTEGLMDARRLRLMKEDAILLSMGRGSVLDQEALAAVMGEGRLWGAALDVTVPEPLPQDSPLWTIPNLIITPHSAGGMRLEVTRANCVRQALDNLNRWQAGKPLENLVRR